MLEGVDITVSYAPVGVTHLLFIIISITYVEGLITFALDFSNAFQNTIYTTLHKESISDYHIHIWIGTK